MTEMSLDDLRRILRACGGEDSDSNLAEDIADTPFGALGYDSLALIATAAMLEREYGVHVDDDVISESATPRMVTDFVNSMLARA